MRIAPPVEHDFRVALLDELRAKALRRRLWRPCLRAEIGPARRASPPCGERSGFTGWTPYPHSAARAALACGPFAALGQVPSIGARTSPHTWNALARARSGPGLYAPGLRHRGWGRFRLGPHALPAPPTTTVSGGPLTAASAGRLRSPSGGSAPGGAAWSVVRFSDFGTFARLRPPPTGRLQTGASPGPAASRYPSNGMASSSRVFRRLLTAVTASRNDVAR